MATRSSSSLGQKSGSAIGGRGTKSAVFGQGIDKNKKKPALAVPMIETPKQLQRRFLKLYERNCGADDCKILNSIKKTLREGIQQESLQARFFIHTLEQPLSELEAILNENTSTKISIIPFVNALRQTRYVHIRLLYIWSIVLNHDEIMSLAFLLDKGSYLLKHIELIDCMIEALPLQRLSQSFNDCSTLTSVSLDYNSFGDRGCRALCAGLRGNRTMLSLSLNYCDITAASGPNLGYLVGTTAIRELYLDGNTLECEGVVELLRLLVRQAGIEREERIMEEQRKAAEAAQAASLEKDKKYNYSFKDPDNEPAQSTDKQASQKKKKKRRKGKKSKKKPPPPPPPVGAWIHKLHLADNGIDARGKGNTLDLPGQSGTVVLHDCLLLFAQLIRCSKCLVELDLHDNHITELGGHTIAQSLLDREEDGLPNIKIRTTHRISPDSLSTIVALGAGLQKKKSRKKRGKKK